MSDSNVSTMGTSGLPRPSNHAGLAEDTVAGTARLAVRVAGALTLAALLIALMTRLYFAIQARRWLAYPFTGVPAKPGAAAGIFAHNLRTLLTVGGALLVAQILTGQTRDPVSAPRVVRLAVGLLVAVAVLGNLVVVGVSFGAYGPRMISATLPHGPIELASYSLALALYLQGRHRGLAVSHVAKIAAVSVALLALAAALETFVNV